MTGGIVTLTPQEKVAWLRLTRTETVGAITFHTLIRRYKSASAALEAVISRYSSVRPIRI